MITKKQKKFYTELHDRLGDVYLVREEQKKALVEYYTGFRKFIGDAIDSYKAKSEIESTDPMMDVALEMQAQEDLVVMNMITSLSHRYYEWIAAGIVINDEIMAMMKKMMDYNKQLSASDSNPEMAEVLLTGAETRIIELENKVKPFDEEFAVHKNEYAELRKIINKKHN